MAPRIPKELAKLAVPIGDVQEHPLNARVGDVDSIMESLRTNGQFRAIVANKRNGYILAGNHTHRAAVNLKWTKIAVTYVDADEDAERRILAADNATSRNAGYDDAKLLELLEPLGDLTGTGWTKDALLDVYERQRDASPTKPKGDPNAIPDPPRHAPICKPGDVWKLGPHRLVVGDATNPHDIDAVMGADQAHMIFTDPPYNVDYQGAAGKIENDKMERSAFAAFLEAAFTSALRHLRKGGAWYVCGAHTTEPEVRAAIDATPEMRYAQSIVWAKHAFTIGRSDYQWQHEIACYGWREGAAHKWYGGRNKPSLLEDDPTLMSIQPVDSGFRIRIGNGTHTIVLTVPSYDIEAAHEDSATIWRFDKPSRNPDHPTMKPVELVQRAIRNSSKLRQIVLDPFGGSGTTMIAADIEGRVARLVELDPKYADVICRRWQEYADDLPIRDGKPVSFAPRDDDQEGDD